MRDVMRIFILKQILNLTYISGVFDLFLPLKNSGRALLSIAWILENNIEETITM